MGAVVALVAGGIVTWLSVRDTVGPLLGGDRCTATVQGRTVELDPEQAENAALIAAISVRRGMPARAATIAIATAYQESKLTNIDYGDRDSIGLFQQRPSQGWGTRAQILDPEYSINAFYDALVGVDGYESLEVTVAAQEVQRSGFPDAYADHEADARVLASALTGQSWRAFHCTVTGDPDRASTRLDSTGLTTRAALVRDDLEAAFGPQSLGGFAPGGVRDGHMKGSAHYDGRAVDIFFRPISRQSREGGWALAHYLVAHADRLEIRTVIYDGRIWTSGWRSGDGWRRYTPDTSTASPETAAILEHRDHVHVDVHE
ncbi:hypothetical protein EXE57_16475 [Nocardioides euryhalodurans]|uniref:ARB-07466-like C-terminal domain-containing protein n=1 Tax=Nocardioides euryhalodurans TaxID=2518370 RepID=A0A4P7GQU7_9ACTN|nr:hypothetical protein EXE57_16475 [Nocardioides euryhalodurans]